MKTYNKFAPFYDMVMGDRKESTGQLIGFLRTYQPNARRILELGCGTGSVLRHFGKRYELWGLDLSNKMLAVAKSKVPHAKLFRRNMVSFRLAQRFDVIFCIFDSINHLLSFTDWKRTFANAHRHLADGGVFIFDINTQKKLRRLIAEPPWCHAFGPNVLLINVSNASRGVSNWNVKVFEHTRRNQYVLHEENINEISFPEKKVTSALKKYFNTITVVDPDRNDWKRKGERLYFICKRDQPYSPSTSLRSSRLPAQTAHPPTIVS
jgi:SAM-dependent methyltransferase